MNDISITVGIISLIVSILGVWLSFVYVRAPRPLNSVRLSKLSGIKHHKLKITFDNKEVPNLYSIRQVFWNGGKKEIRKEDIPTPKAGPYINLSNNCEILSFSARTTTGDNSEEFIINDNNLSLSFNYLNKGDAFLGEIYFTSKDNDLPDFSFKGSLKGASINEGELSNISLGSNIFMIITAVLFLFLTLISGYLTFFVASENIANKIPVAFMFLFILSLTILDFKVNILSIPNKIPKKYLKFLETGEM